jgi:hypothetical protein
MDRSTGISRGHSGSGMLGHQSSNNSSYSASDAGGEKTEVEHALAQILLSICPNIR